VLRKELEETALFQVTVATSPESGGDFSSFKPKFSDYAVIVWNYDAPNWPADLRAQLEQYHPELDNNAQLKIVHGKDSNGRIPFHWNVREAWRESYEGCDF
jgi:hypothetical protein